tara:strand:- start:280 stop:639 length:360 start_codon:yes stop_codon:yes gene_type:complete
MSESEQLGAFLSSVEADEALQGQLKNATDASEVLAIAKEAGFEITEEELLNLQNDEDQELSAEELESAAGGFGASPADTCSGSTCHTSIGQDMAATISQLKFSPSRLFGSGRFRSRQRR